MADRISSAHRSWNMSRIRGKNTTPERAVRSIIHRLGYRFRLHAPSLPGHPDIVLARLKTVVFVHGCFWHRHAGCKYAYEVKSNVGKWESKFARNVDRDHRNQKALQELGRKVIVVWACELRNANALGKRLSRALKRRSDQTAGRNTSRRRSASGKSLANGGYADLRRRASANGPVGILQRGLTGRKFGMKQPRALN